MALLNQEDEENQQTGSPVIQPAQPSQPILPAQQAPAPVQATQSGISQQAQPVTRQVQRKGTGFTNLNRIMQANVGNKLGQSVAGGVTGQVQNLQSGVQSSQQKFSQQAQQGRLDTPDAIAKRQQVLGRFDPNNFQVDESKFQVSSGLQDQYGNQKSTLETQQSQQKAEVERQRAMIQAQYDKNLAEMNKLLDRSKAGYQSGIGGMVARSQDQKLIKGYQASLNSFKGLLGGVGKVSKAQEAEIANKLTNLESQYGTMSEAEKASFIQSEKDRMMTEALPNEQEIEAFRRYQTGAYTGPNELQDYQSLLGKAQQTEDLGTLARSSGGRQELLKQFVGGRDYTQGQRGLDEAILAQDKSSLLSRAAKKAAGAEQDVARANSAAAAQAKEYISRAKGFGEETRAQIQAARAPISTQVDTQMQELQNKEAQRQTNFKSIQDILSGSDPKYAKIDKTARTGLALQAAMDAGYITPQEAESLAGKGGLIERSQALGLDTNKMLAERMKDLSAQGIDRRAAAGSGQESIISTLDKLMGKTGTDVEFGTGQEQYQAGKTSFDVNNFRDFIAKTEAEKMKDPAYAAKMKTMGITPLQQIMGGTFMTADALSSPGATAGFLAPGVAGALAGGGTASLAGMGSGAYLGAAAPVAAAGMLGYDALTGGDSTAQAVEGAVQTSSGVAGMNLQAKNAILDSLFRNKIGGSEAGKQIQNLLKYEQQLEQEGLGTLTKEGMNYAGGFRDLTQTGKLDQALSKLTGADAVKNLAGNAGREISKGISNVGKAVSTAFGGGDTGHWTAAERGAIDVKTGKAVKIGSFANKSSKDILAQIMNQKQLARTSALDTQGSAGGAMEMNELIKYWQAALKREGKI